MSMLGFHVPPQEELQTDAKPVMRLSHTPAPWKIDGQFDAEAAIGIYAGDMDGDFTPICELEPSTEDWTPEEIANAHLIKAAPELLDALKAAVQGCPCSLAEPVSGHRIECFAIQALEAIAKAEGRA